MAYQLRVVDAEIDELFSQLPAIVIEGAKGVGKTETARRRARTIYRLDIPTERAIAEVDPSVLLEQPPPVLLDEWQNVPALWDAVRRSVDDGAPPGSFILTGSANANRRPSHSGAGRIVTLRMRPLSLAERGLETPTVHLRELLKGGRAEVRGKTSVGLREYTDEITRSGFPGLRHLADRSLRAQLDGYIDRIVDSDFPEEGLRVRRPEILRRWMRSYAAATATVAGYEEIRDAATAGEGEKPAKTTTKPYRDTLENLWILESLPAWLPTRNHLNRLARSPKHHIVDPALAARLIRVGTEALLQGDEPGPPIPRDGTLLGHLFESLVTQSIRVYAQASEASVSHMRTHGGKQEVDLIVERDDGRFVAIEVKLNPNVNDNDVRHLHWLRQNAGDDMLDAVVITAGPYAYRRKDGVAVVPAVLMGV